MTRDEKIRFVVRLTRATLENGIEWRKVENARNLTDKGLLTSAVYQTELESSCLRLYRTEGRRPFWSEGQEEVLWVRRIVLEIRDKDGDSLVEIDQDDADSLKALLDTVRERTSTVFTDIRKKFNLVQDDAR